MNSNRLFSGFAVFLLSIAIFSFVLSTNSNITVFQAMGGIISTSILPVSDVLFTFICLFGAGYFVSLVILKINERAQLNAFEFLYLCILLGAALVSCMLFLLGIAGLLHPEVILCLKVVFSLVGGFIIIKMLLGKISLESNQYPIGSIADKAFPSTVFFFVLLVLFGASTSPVICVDAMAYHFGLPWFFLQNHAIHFYPTNAGSGQYIAGDLLYLLTLHSGDPWNIFSTKLFNASLEGFLFVATFLSVRRNNVSRAYAYFACILLFSIPAIWMWGTGKNDLFIAGLCLSVLWLFRIYDTHRSDGWLYCMFLLGGFAVSVKILAAPIIVIGGILLLLFFIKERLKIKKYLIACGIGSIPVIPWALYAFHYRHNPFHPLVASIFFETSGYFSSASYLAESAARNSSGLSLTIGNFFGQILPLIVGTSQYSRGNYTSALGYFFIAAALIGMLYLIKREMRKYSYYWIVGMLNLIALAIAYFDTWLLMRYFIFSAAAVFVFFVTVIANSRYQATPFQKVALIILTIFALNSGPMTRMWQAIMNDSDRAMYLSGQLSRDNYIKTFSAPYERTYDYVLTHLKPGEKVLINDGMVFGLKSDYINVHSLHSNYIRYDTMDASGFADFMKDQRVSVALFRPQISGITPQLLHFLKNQMTLTQKIEPYELYELNKVL